MAAVSSETSDKIRIIGFFLTIAVVLHHAHNLQFATGNPDAWLRYLESVFHYGLRGLAVPFFFVCSGYFLCARDGFLRAWPAEVGKRARSLLLPFVLWSGGWILAMWALQSLPHLGACFGREAISLRDGRQVLDLMTLDPIPHPLWYMRDLFVLAIASPLALWAMRRWSTAVVWFVVAIGLYFSVPAIEVRESGDLLFFGAGVALAAHRGRIPRALARPPRAFSWGLLVASLALIGYHCWWVDTYHAECQWILNTAVIIGLPALWWTYDDGARYLRTAAMLAAADYALFIYMAHEPAVTIVRKSTLALAGESTSGLAAVWLGSAVAVMATAVAAATVLRRYVPAAYGVLTGGRLGAARNPPRLPEAAVAPAASALATG
jgi:succinoglycan biosynthesis protein ExoH